MGDKEIGWMIITSYSRSLEKQAENAMEKRSSERTSDTGRAPQGGGRRGEMWHPAGSSLEHRQVPPAWDSRRDFLPGGREQG